MSEPRLTEEQRRAILRAGLPPWAIVDPHSSFELPPERRIITPAWRRRIVTAVVIAAAVAEAALVGFILLLVLSTP